MRTEEGSPASTAKGSPRSGKTTSHTTTARAFTHGSSHRRWNRKPITFATDAAAWALFTALTAAGLLALCALVWIIAGVWG